MIQRRRVEELWRSRDFRALIFLGVLAVLTLILAIAIRGILGPFLLAAILALIVNPAVNAAERRRVPRAVAILVLYGVLAGILAAGVFYLVPVVRQEVDALVAQGPAIASYFQNLADEQHVVSVLGIPIDLRQAYTDSVRNLPALLAGHLSSVVENVFMLVNWIFQTVLILLVAFFLVKDAHAIRRFFEGLIPHGYRTDARDLAAEIYRMLGAYMRGQLLICALVGLFTGVALWLVGVPYSLVLGIAVHLSPMLVIIAFVVGGYLGGILGLFVAVPAAAALRILFLYAHERVYA